MPDDGVTGERLAPHPSGASAQPPSSFRAGLTRGEDAVDVATWAGSVPAATGVAPRMRVGSKWFNLLWLLPVGFLVLLGAVAAAKGLRNTPRCSASSARIRAPICAPIAGSTWAFRRGRDGSTSSTYSS